MFYTKNMKDIINKALKILKAGGVIAFPTETVFGLGALLSSKKGTKKIYKIKNRPENKPLQILVATFDQALKIGKFNKETKDFAKYHWPGPYTLLVPAVKGSEKIGLRMPKHKLMLELLKKCGPIAATSANTSGMKPIKTSKEVEKSLTGIDYIIPGKAITGKSSKVIDTTEGFKIVRA